MRVGMIWANARKGAIGKNNDMPWHLPEDLKHFKETTLGKPVVMGRRTWESLPEKFRPLPGRKNYVVTGNPLFEAAGAHICDSLETAIAEARKESENAVGDSDGVDLWIMGGGMLYREGMNYAETLSVTEIDTEVIGADTYAPEIGADWQLISEEPFIAAKNGLRYRFLTYVRRKKL